MYKNFIKRLFDIIISMFVLLLLWPVYIFIALLIKIKIGGPIFFKQIRPGANGKFFTLIKFRSMTNEADSHGSLLPDEKRLTSFGKFLRKTSLDEIPEVINILKGEMSIIGPRPQLVDDYVFFSDDIMKRQTVRPGLSGLAQINGRNSISWEKKFEYDLMYVDNISFWLDIKITFKTIILAFVKRKGINKPGFATDENYGDYLLRNKIVSQAEYNDKIIFAKELVKKNGK